MSNTFSPFHRLLLAIFTFGAVTVLPRAAAAGWTLTKIAQVGEGGITEISKGVASANGLVVVRGTGREGAGLYLMQNQAATPVVVVGTEMGAGLGKVTAVSDNFFVDDLGRVDFEATAKEGTTTRSGCFRLENGRYSALLPEGGFTHLLTKRSPDGRWLVFRQFTQNEVGQTEISYTNGTTHSVVLTQPERVGSAQVAIQFEPAGNGTLGVLRTITETTTNANGNTLARKETSEMVTVGTAARAIATATLNSTIDPESGVLVGAGKKINYFISDQAGSSILYVETTVANSRTSSAGYFRNTTSGTTQILSVDPLTSSFDALAIDAAGRVVGRFADASSTFITGSVNASTDKIIGIGDALFGDTVRSISVRHVPETPSTFGDRRVALLEYRLSVSNQRGIALASRAVTRWGAGVDGSWNVAANWSTQTVPVANTEVLFDQEANYTVTVGSAVAGRLSVENSTVTFQQPNLSITGLFGVGGDAKLSQTDGAISVGELTVGVLPPASVVNEPTASLRLSNTGTTFTASGPLEIGSAGAGEVTVSGGSKLVSAAARMGAGSPGTAIVTGASAVWESGPLAVGDRRGATLTIESAGSVVSTSAVIGRGDTFLNEIAEVNATNGTAVTTIPQLGNWFVNTDLTIADKLPGRLRVKEGGAVAIGRNLEMSLVKLPADFPAAAGVIEVSGANTNAANQSQLFVFGNANLGVGAETLSLVAVEAGGSLFVSNDVNLGLGSNSGTQVIVSGRDTAGRRSALEAGTSTASRLVVGAGGDGFLEVSDGALVSGRTILIGGPSGSSGSVLVRGQKVEPALLKAQDHLVVGGSSLFATADDAEGRLTVEDGGRVEAPSLAVFGKGTLEGNGTVAAATMVIEGAITPAIGDGAAIVQRAEVSLNGKTSRLGSSAFSLPGTESRGEAVGLGNVLTLVGDVTLRDSARLTFSFSHGSSSPIAKLAVVGKLKAAGTVVLEFTEGAAPRSGDVFNVITATSGEGAFRAVEFRGLAPGFNASVSLSAGGAVSVTALNDAVPATLPVIFSQPTSQEMRSGAVATFEVSSSGTTFQWRRNGVPLPGATGSRLLIDNVTADDAGDYDVVVGNAAGVITSDRATLQIKPTSGRLINLSVRTGLIENQNLIVGFYVAEGAKPCLLRAVGPGLDTFLSGALRNPTLALFDQSGIVVAQNDNWGSELKGLMKSVGAFDLASGSGDAALLTTLQGLRSAHVNGSGAGVVLVELYDADLANPARLINLSARGRVGTGGDVLIAGFGIEGPGSLKVLVRGIGPSLASFGVTGSLQDPELTVYSQGGSVLATNDDWPASQASAHIASGAFALATGSKDSAVLISLAPGIYTVHLQGKNAGTGEGLIEVYDMGSP